MAANHDYNWHDSIHSGGGVCGANSTQPCDDNGHGTHTAGTAVGWDGGTNQIGVAPGAKWIGCRNMDQGNGTPATYIECYEFFLAPYPVGGTPAQGNPALAPDVVVNSWGCNPDSLLAAVQANRAAGIFHEHSAGNSGPGCSTVNDPSAIYDEVFSVGALTTGSDSLASFSSRGPVTVDGSGRVKPDIAAPGTSTRSAYRTNDTAYTSLSGTSMAGPHVAGAAALVISARPAMRGKVDLIEQVLSDSAFRLSTSSCSSMAGVYPNNLFGYGRLDAQAAVSLTLSIGTVAGLVTDINTSTPISNAVIAAQRLDGATFDGSSDAGGVYGMEVYSGTYTLTVSAPGYLPTSIGGVAVNATLTTTQNVSLTPIVYGVSLIPPGAAMTTTPGSVLTYTLTVTNTGNFTDTFTVTVSGNAYAAAVPSPVGPLADGASASLPVTVTVPTNAAEGASDTAVITVTSQGNGVASASATLTTNVVWRRLYMPLVGH
jgi:subtilisin family serine protease